MVNWLDEEGIGNLSMQNMCPAEQVFFAHFVFLKWLIKVMLTSKGLVSYQHELYRHVSSRRGKK
jgi:hypothetical protein